MQQSRLYFYLNFARVAVVARGATLRASTQHTIHRTVGRDAIAPLDGVTCADRFATYGIVAAHAIERTQRRRTVAQLPKATKPKTSEQINRNYEHAEHTQREQTKKKQ